MPSLSRSQLALLHLLVKEEGSGIALVQRLAGVYGVEEGRLGPDLLRLVEERLIWPAGAISHASFLPPFFLPSPEAQRLVESLADEVPPRLPPLDASTASRIRADFQASPTPPKMPPIEALPKEALLLLSTAYHFWAQQPPSNKPRTPSHQLYLAAAWGYATAGEREQFTRTLRAGLKAWVADGQVHGIPDLCARVAQAFPHHAHSVMEIAAIVMEPPSRLLRQRSSADVTSQDSLGRFVHGVTQAAGMEAKAIRLRLPEAHLLIEAALVVEKLFVQAFALQSRPLFLNAVQLLTLNIRQARSMVSLGGQVGTVLPMVVRMTLAAEQVVISMERFADLVELPDLQRKEAGLAAAALARAVMQATTIPQAHLINLARGQESQMAQWAMRMMYASEKGLALRAAKPLLLLERLALTMPLAEAPESALAFLVSDADVERASAALIDMAERLDVTDPRASQFIPLSGLECEVLERLSDYLRVAQAFPLSLSARCDVVRAAPQIISLVDRALRPMLSQMRQSVLDWLVAARKDNTLSALRKSELMRHLGELEKGASPSQYLLRLPSFIELWEAVGPGEILNTWNQWLDYVRRTEVA